MKRLEKIMEGNRKKGKTINKFIVKGGLILVGGITLMLASHNLESSLEQINGMDYEIIEKIYSIPQSEYEEIKRKQELQLLKLLYPTIEEEVFQREINHDPSLKEDIAQEINKLFHKTEDDIWIDDFRDYNHIRDGDLLIDNIITQVALATQYHDIIAKYAKMNNTPIQEIYSVVVQESCSDQNARSPKNAVGLMQLMNYSIFELRIDNVKDERYDPELNIEKGTPHLKSFINNYTDSGYNEWIMALIAYNAGPQRAYSIIKSNINNNWKDIKEYLLRQGLDETVNFVIRINTIEELLKNSVEYKITFHRMELLSDRTIQYKIQKGDTISKIIKKFDMSKELQKEFQRLNGKIYKAFSSKIWLPRGHILYIPTKIPEDFESHEISIQRQISNQNENYGVALSR